MDLQVGLGSHSPAPPQQSYRRCLEFQASTEKKNLIESECCLKAVERNANWVREG